MKFKKEHLLYLLLFTALVITTFFFSYNKTINKIDLEQFNVQKLSSEKIVINYLRANHKLPDYYITKRDARKHGWKPEKGNLCTVLPGKVIGGDIFSNRQHIVPSKKGRRWFEADIDYNCGKRGEKRVVFSNDGLIFVTHNHYKTFQQR